MTGGLVARVVVAVVALLSCSVCGLTVRVHPPLWPGGANATAVPAPGTPTAGAVVAPPPGEPVTVLPPPMTVEPTVVRPGDGLIGTLRATVVRPGDVLTGTVQATSVPTETVQATREALAGAVGALIPFQDPQGRFHLAHDAGWREVGVPAASGPVAWVVRLERGQPDVPVPDGAKVPPDGVTFDVGVAEGVADADLSTWAFREIALDTVRFSVTADGMSGTVGSGRYDAVWREGQILPFFGRWREWSVPDPATPGRVFVLRVLAWGRGDEEGMLHGVYLAQTFALP
jgi:hypothetical protein